MEVLFANVDVSSVLLRMLDGTTLTRLAQVSRAAREAARADDVAWTHALRKLHGDPSLPSEARLVPARAWDLFARRSLARRLRRVPSMLFLSVDTRRIAEPAQTLSASSRAAASSGLPAMVHASGGPGGTPPRHRSRSRGASLDATLAPYVVDPARAVGAFRFVFAESGGAILAFSDQGHIVAWPSLSGGARAWLCA